jgi:hypothetical protein
VRLVLVMLLTSVLLGGCSGSVHVKDRKSICLGLCVYSETDATTETAEGSK